MRTKTSLLTMWLVAACASGVHAQNTSQESAGGQSLAAQARDPTASVTAFQITLKWNSFHGVDTGTDAALQLQPIIPFRIGRQAHLARVSASILVEAVDFSATNPPPPDLPPPNQVPSGSVRGLQDTAIVDVMVWRTSFGSWGLGPVVSIPTATDSLLGSGKFSVGPAFVVVLRKGAFQGGFLGQGFFSVAGDEDREDVDVVALQPFAGFGLPANWSVGLSEINIAYDTRRGKWTSVPFGLRLERLVSMGRLPVRLYGDVEYNFISTTYAPRWTFRFTFTPLL